MKAINIQQGTPEWKQARVGKITASRISDVMAKGKSGEAVSRRDYRFQIIAETLTGVPQDEVYQNAAMQWGNETEAMARAAYGISTGHIVDQVGLVIHDANDRFAASPDGLVGWDLTDAAPEGLVEIKCPKTSTHIRYLREKSIPTDYQLQMLWQMACTGAQWCDFVSFDPRLPDHLQLLVVRFQRDKDRIPEIEGAVLKFLEEVDSEIKSLPMADQLAKKAKGAE